MRRLAASSLILLTATFLVGSLRLRAHAPLAEIAIVESATRGVTINNQELQKLPVSVQVDEVIRTAPDAYARLVLTGGATVLVQPDSELKIARHDAAAERTVVALAHGFVLAQSAPDARDTSEFRIETTTGIATTADGSLTVRTGMDPIGLGMGMMTFKLLNGGKPVAKAGVSVVAQGVTEPVPVGRTNDDGVAHLVLDFVQGGNREVIFPYPLIDYSRFIRQDLRVIAQTCDDGSHEIYLQGEDAKLPEEPKKCKRQTLKGKLQGNWTDSLAVDYGRDTIEKLGIDTSVPLHSGIGTTIVMSWDKFVTVTAPGGSKSKTQLLPGQASAVDAGRDPSSAVRFDHLQLQSAFGVNTSDKNAWFLPGLVKDFTPDGKLCQPVWVLNGVQADSKAKFDVDMNGAGTSTGNAIEVFGTNQSECAVYFMVTDGTILSPKGMTKRVVTTMLTGGVPSLDNFQRVITAGVFFRIPPHSKDVAKFMRAYCVDLHKLAPHQQTEYKVGSEEDQKLYWFRPIVDTGFMLTDAKRLVSATGAAPDSVIQWSLWSAIEDFSPQQFSDEFTKLVHKNYEAKKKKWDSAAQKETLAAMQDMWQLTNLLSPHTKK